jgi:hypothetical protein
MSPALIATTPLRLLTATGTFESVFDPFPNCPKPFKPQHWTVPPVTTAHVWPKPALIATAPLRLLTGTGTFEAVFDPFPNCPEPL